MRQSRDYQPLGFEVGFLEPTDWGHHLPRAGTVCRAAASFREAAQSRSRGEPWALPSSLSSLLSKSPIGNQLARQPGKHSCKGHPPAIQSAAWEGKETDQRTSRQMTDASRKHWTRNKSASVGTELFFVCAFSVCVLELVVLIWDVMITT